MARQCAKQGSGLARWRRMGWAVAGWAVAGWAAAWAEGGGELGYGLERGYIRHWLVAGPRVERVAEVGPFQGADDDATKWNVWRHFEGEGGVGTERPKEGGPAAVGVAGLEWLHYPTADDRAVTFPEGGGCVFLQAWMYAEVECAQAVEGEWELGGHGPVEVWVNGRTALRAEEMSTFVPRRNRFRAGLRAGRNTVLVRGEAVKIRVGVFGLSLRLPEEAAGCRVILPTLLPEVAARQRAEALLAAAYLDRETFRGEEEVVLHWAEGPGMEPGRVEISARRGREESQPARVVTAGPGAVVRWGKAAELGAGRHTLRLRPAEVADPGVRERCEVELVFTVRPEGEVFASEPYGTREQRRQEMLEKTAGQGGLNGEIAKMHLGRWEGVQVDPFQQAMAKINRRQDTSDFELTAILGALHRYGGREGFPEALRAPLRECVLGFRYWADEPGTDVMWFWSENHQIAFHTCEILAGQLFPGEVFRNVGETGAWHREKGERLALTWLRKRATGGFHEWDSNTYFYIDLLALSHLAELAESGEVRHLAEVVMTKMLLTVAFNSFQGVFGSAHARTYPSGVKQAWSEGTSGSSWLLWGLGSNGFTPLVFLENYRLPPLVEKVATGRPAEFWNRERHGGTLDPAVDYFGGPWEVNKVTYRTPDGMLSSAQDFRAGQRGNMQHIWQATFGPEAPVFVNHPPFMAESGSPNFWVGNLVLPRVAQWKDVLIDVRSHPPGAGMGFTHAYFPLHAFDEWREEGGWVVARRGEGYVALRSRAGMEWQRSGRYAWRELRSYADEDAWICHLGSRRQDGSFARFAEGIRNLPVEFRGGKGVALKTLRGDRLEFGWEGPFRRNGAEVPLSGFPHYDNPCGVAPFPADRFHFRCGGEELELRW